MTLKDIPNAISSQELVDGQLRLGLPDGAMTIPCGQEAVHASPSQVPVDKKAKKTNAIFGLNGSA